MAPVDVNKIIAHNEKKEAEASIDEMVEDSDDEETIAMVEAIDEAPEAETQKEEKVEEEPKAKTPKEEQMVEETTEKKEKGSFFDQFD